MTIGTLRIVDSRVSNNVAGEADRNERKEVRSPRGRIETYLPGQVKGSCMSNLRLVAFTLTGMVAFILIVASAAAAAESLFLKLGDIQGESTDSTHQGEIVLISYSQSFTNAGGRGAVPTNCGAVTVTKSVDRSSPALIGAVLRGTQIASGVITFRTEGTSRFEFYKVILTDILINAISQIDASPTDPTTIQEQISLNAREIRFEYTPQLPTGAPGAPVAFGWNCVANAPQ
jgi:type VI secretion system secreted protein Hcp